MATTSTSDRAALVVRVLKLRQAVLRVTISKLEAGIDACEESGDSRLREMLVYGAAHTGRFSSRGMQVHNLPHGHGEMDYDGLINNLTLDRVNQEAARLKISADDVLSCLIRPCIVSAPGHSLIRADYSQIECRAGAWMADDERLLEDLAGDVYKGMASGMFGVPISEVTYTQRQIGKIVVLGCGYGLSGDMLEVFCKNKRIDLAAVGITAHDAVKSFRSRYSGIVTLWRRLNRLCMLAIERGRPADIGKCQIDYGDGALRARLPSGRILHWRAARIEDRIPTYAIKKNLPIGPQPTIVYQSPRGERTLYGGKIMENLDQAICSDLLRDTLIKMEANDLRPVLHVHDEPIGEVPDDRAAEGLDLLLKIMKEGPAWAVGLPIKAEGGVTKRYVK